MEARKQPDPMALTITLTPADVGAWSLQINDLQRKKRNPWAGLSTLLTFFAAMIASALLVTVIYWALDGNRVPLGDALRFLPGILLDHVAVPLFVLCCAFGPLSLSQRKILQRRIMALVGESATEVPVSVRISEHGIDYEEPHIPTRIGWLGIKSISETPDHYFVAVNALRAFVIPKRDLSADQQRIVSEWFKSHGPTDTTA